MGFKTLFGTYVARSGGKKGGVVTGRCAERIGWEKEVNEITRYSLVHQSGTEKQKGDWGGEEAFPIHMTQEPNKEKKKEGSDEKAGRSRKRKTSVKGKPPEPLLPPNGESPVRKKELGVIKR